MLLFHFGIFLLCENLSAQDVQVCPDILYYPKAISCLSAEYRSGSVHLKFPVISSKLSPISILRTFGDVLLFQQQISRAFYNFVIWELIEWVSNLYWRFDYTSASLSGRFLVNLNFKLFLRGFWMSCALSVAFVWIQNVGQRRYRKLFEVSFEHSSQFNVSIMRRRIIMHFLTEGKLFLEPKIWLNSRGL